MRHGARSNMHSSWKHAMVTALSLMVLVVGCKQTQPDAHLIIDTLSLETEAPRNFRILPHFKPLQGLKVEGLANVRASGSGQFNPAGLKWIEGELKRQGIAYRELVIVDLREEPHGMVDGQAVSWYAKNNHYVMGVSWREAQAKEKQLLEELKQQKVIEVLLVNKFTNGAMRRGEAIKLQPQGIMSEGELVGHYPHMRYLRAPIADHDEPEPRDVDQLLALFEQSTPHTWIHFHCRAGQGRTTTALILYDTWINAGKTQLSIEDVAERQRLIGGADILGRGERENASVSERARAKMVRNFWRYVLARRQGETLRFSQWLAEPHKELRQTHLEGRYLQSHPISPKDRVNAINLIKKAADGGYRPAKFQYALAMHDGMGLYPKPEAALLLLKDLIPSIQKDAEQGQLEAMVEYAELLRRGLAVAQDLSQARSLLQKAAEAGHVEAMYLYADYLRNGLGGVQDMQGAHTYFERASMMGHKDAKQEFAHFLNAGEAGISDPQKAGDLLRELAESGHLGGTIWYMHWLNAHANTAADKAKAAELSRKVTAALGHAL